MLQFKLLDYLNNRIKSNDNIFADREEGNLIKHQISNSHPAMAMLFNDMYNERAFTISGSSAYYNYIDETPPKNSDIDFFINPYMRSKTSKFYNNYDDFLALIVTPFEFDNTYVNFRMNVDIDAHEDRYLPMDFLAIYGKIGENTFGVKSSKLNLKIQILINKNNTKEELNLIKLGKKKYKDRNTKTADSSSVKITDSFGVEINKKYLNFYIQLNFIILPELVNNSIFTGMITSLITHQEVIDRYDDSNEVSVKVTNNNIDFVENEVLLQRFYTLFYIQMFFDFENLKMCYSMYDKKSYMIGKYFKKIFYSVDNFFLESMSIKNDSTTESALKLFFYLEDDYYNLYEKMESDPNKFYFSTKLIDNFFLIKSKIDMYLKIYENDFETENVDKIEKNLFHYYIKFYDKLYTRIEKYKNRGVAHFINHVKLLNKMDELNDNIHKHRMTRAESFGQIRLSEFLHKGKG